jgi:hypothetical protein
MFLHVTSAKYLEGYRVWIEFSDGTAGEIDLSGSLSGPIFLLLKDPEYFRDFRIEGHTLAWSNGADFAPEYLHDLAKSQALA